MNSCRLKKKLVAEGFLEERCYTPGCPIQASVWLDRTLILQLDHIDGDNTNNELANLRILCPNCHTQTETWGRRKTLTEYTCIDCGVRVSWKANRCRPCNMKIPRPKFDRWPDDEALLRLVRDTSNSQVARELGVSETAVRKRLKVLGGGLEPPS